MWKLNHFECAYRNQSRQIPKYDRRCRAVHDMHLDNKDREVETQDSDVMKSNVFNYHSSRSLTITKLKTRSSQKVDA